jgi:hypothetical protein
MSEPQDIDKVVPESIQEQSETAMERVRRLVEELKEVERIERDLLEGHGDGTS